MTYIKIVIFTIILGLLAGGKILFHLPVGPEYMLCFSVCYAFADRKKIHAVVMSAVIAIISSALTDRYLLFCVMEYGIAACFISELFTKKTKLDIVFCMAVTLAITLVGETVFYELFILNNVEIGNFFDIIIRESALNVIASAIMYVILFKIFNPKKKRYRITVE